MNRIEKPLITVVGATSKQGRSVVNSLTQSRRFRVRALTRRKNSPLALQLQKAGAELWELDPHRNPEALLQAFEGSAGAFLMTPPSMPGRDDERMLGRQLANAAATGAGAVIVNPTDSDAMAPAVKQLTDAKIPVVAVDRAVNNAEVSSYIASDNVGGGKQAAKALSEAIHGEGEILVLQGKTGSSASRERGKGFDEGLKDNPNIKVVAKQTAEFERAKGLDVTTNLLQAHPNVKAIFAENDEMALGAIEALGSKAGKDVKVIGFDGAEDALKAIKDGRMYASIAQQPVKMAEQAVIEASKLLKGETATKKMQVEVVAATKENVDKFSS